MNSVRQVCCGALFSLLALLPTLAQKQTAGRPPSAITSYKLLGIKVTGTTRYNDKEILAATGLRIGQPAADGDFKEAVRRLGNSGFFSDLEYTYTSADTGVKLELKLIDTDKAKLVPAEFENFVWFSDAELAAALEDRIPLFKDLLPLTGDMPDEVAEALQAMLSEKKLPGHIDFVRSEGETSGTLSVIAYRVREVTIRIHGFAFPGASPEQSDLLTTAAHRLVGTEYERSILAGAAKFDLLPVYRQRGYLKAAFEPPAAHVVPRIDPPTGADADTPADVEVDAILPVKPGQQYVVSTVDWKGTSAIPTTEVAPLLHLAPGQPADAVRLERDVERVAKLYRSRGYMTIKIEPLAKFDDDKSTAHYDINVVEGAQYKMGEIDILGLDNQVTAQMQNAWMLKEGQPYNADFLKKFLDDTRPLLPRGAPWGVTTHVTPDSRDKTVDVEIRFRQQ